MIPVFAALAAASLSQAAWPSNVGPGVPKFWVRPGFKVTLVAEKLGNARFMEFDDQGILYLSRPEQSDVVMLKRQGDAYVEVGKFVEDQPSIHGLHFKDGWMWFTRSDAVLKAKVTGGKATEVVEVLTGLPKGGHWWRSIYVVEDGFFTSIGDSGNINDDSKTDRQKIWFYSLDGKTRKLWCTGIRNTEKLRYKPGTRDL